MKGAGDFNPSYMPLLVINGVLWSPQNREFKGDRLVRIVDIWELLLVYTPLTCQRTFLGSFNHPF